MQSREDFNSSIVRALMIVSEKLGKITDLLTDIDKKLDKTVSSLKTAKESHINDFNNKGE